MCHMNTLYEQTMLLYKQTNLSVISIARGSGLGLRWLFDLKRGRFDDPGVKKIQRLHDYLINNSLPRA